MKLLTLFTFISLSLFGTHDSSTTPLPKLEVVQLESDASISPKFLFTVSTEEGEFRVLKGIYLNRKNLDGIQATLVTPIGDTALVVFPEISADSLAKAGARPTSLYVSPESQFSVELDLLPFWSKFQESTDSYIGPFPGTYKIRFELGWSDQNWENLKASGILRGLDTKLVKQSLFSDWTSFIIDTGVFTVPDEHNPPKKIGKEGTEDYDLFVVKQEGKISQEWLIDPGTNSEMLLLTHQNPIEVPSKWVKGSYLFNTHPFEIKRFGQWTPNDSISGSFTAYSTHRNRQDEMQEFKGRFISGYIEGGVDIKYLFKINTPKIIHGNFRRGKMNGRWVESELVSMKKYRSAHTITEYFFKDGKRNGLCRRYYSPKYGGGIKKEATYTNNMIDGPDKFYFQNGQLGHVGHFLPRYEFRSLDHDHESQLKFPISAGTQIKHGEFVGYFEDGRLRHRLTFDENVPVGDCEFYYRYGKKRYHTLGSFKDGDYFEGTFIYWEQVKSSDYGRHIPYYKFWILHYHQGSLTEKELIIDTSKEPLLPPKKKKKLFRKKQ